MRRLVVGVCLCLVNAHGCIDAAQTRGSEADIRSESLMAADRQWTYHVYVPSSLLAPPPLMLVLHGSGGDGLEYLVGNRWPAEADARGFVAIAPDAPPRQPDEPADVFANPRLWNVGPLVAGTLREQIDDIGFLDALIEAAVERYGVDPARVYVAGHSGGGSMAFRLASRRSEKIAAIAAVAGLYLEEPTKPARPVPTLSIVGTNDPLLPLEGGMVEVLWLRRTSPPVSEALAAWAAALECAGAPEPISAADMAIVAPDVIVESFRCESAEFVAIRLSRHGHGWPGGGAPSLPASLAGPSRSDFPATKVVTAFLLRHAVPLEVLREQ